MRLRVESLPPGAVAPIPLRGGPVPEPDERPARTPLHRRSGILALVPHFRCEEWLGDCLDSLTSQTRPLDGIVVLDDASEQPPVEVVERFPEVTLLRAVRNVGPYALIQTAIEVTLYDGYLFNDADDWSAPGRLARLLADAERTGAELIGSQELRILCREGHVLPASYPLDVNSVLKEHPRAFPLLHPTSLVARSLVRRVGGFASGMRFSGDAEFLRRAVHVARVVNVRAYLYFRRKRPGALTTSPDTGLRSAARRRVQATLWRRADLNARRVASGVAPMLEPLEVAEPVPLEHVCGPALRAHPAPESFSPPRHDDAARRR